MRLGWSIGLIVFLATLTLVLSGMAARVKLQTRSGRVDAQLAEIAQAVGRYRETYGAWPARLDDLFRNPRRIAFLPRGDRDVLVDPWQRPIVYLPYNADAGCGLLVSWGADGKPGGEHADRDHVVRLDDATGAGKP